jgi:hypothetical protein
MERQTVSISNEDLQDIVYGDHEDWIVIESKVDGNWRHGTEHTGVFQRASDGKFFRMDWRDSVKDECEWRDMNYGCTAKEVFPREVTVTIYE